jgi:hypothetical protein
MSERTNSTVSARTGDTVLAGHLDSHHLHTNTAYKPGRKRFRLYTVTVCLLVLLGTLSALGQQAAAENFEPASVHASPGLNCNVYPTGSSSTDGVPVFTDDDGTPVSTPKRRPKATQFRNSRSIARILLAGLTPILPT